MSRRTRGPVRHGTRSCYVKRKCRKPECVQANARYGRELQLRLGRGQSNFVDAGPVIVRLKELVDFVPLAVLASSLQCSRTTIRVYIGKVAGKQSPTKVRRDFADAVAAFKVWPMPGPRGLVLAIGSERRIQALEFQGQTQTEIANGCGLPRRTINRIANGRRPAVTLGVHNAIKAYYDANFMRKQKGPTRKLGHALAPPGAWDGHVIDDPTAKPDFGIPARTLKILGRLGEAALIKLEDLPSRSQKLRLLEQLGATGDEVSAWLRLDSKGGKYRQMLLEAGVKFA